VYARITDRRRDHLHKPSTRLVRENQALVIEDLSARHMAKVIAAEGLSVLACGDGVRPARA